MHRWNLEGQSRGLPDRPDQLVVLEQAPDEMPSGEAIGIDLGGTKIAAARVLSDGTIVEEREVPVPGSGPEIASAIEHLCQELCTPAVKGVGLGLAGLVQNPGGHFRWGPNVALRDCDFGQRLGSLLNVPVTVDNDANVAAFAEAHVGAAAGAQDVLMITVGTGIGGGIVLGGRLYRGASFAAEVGHITLDPKGPRCSCGRLGCWEALASGRVLTEKAQQLAEHEPQGLIAQRAGETRKPIGRDLVCAAEQGDAKANAAIDELGRWLGLGVHSLLCVLDPEVIVVGGGVSALGERILGPIRAAVEEGYGAAHRARQPDIRGAKLGNKAGVVGAALLSLES